MTIVCCTRSFSTRLADSAVSEFPAAVLRPQRPAVSCRSLKSAVLRAPLPCVESAFALC